MRLAWRNWREKVWAARFRVWNEAAPVRFFLEMAVDIDISPLILAPQPGRTVIRPFTPGYPAGFDDAERSRAQRIVDLMMSFDDETIETELARLEETLILQHRNADAVLLRRFEELRGSLFRCSEQPRDRALLIGACFSQEYSFEAAALFNPTMVLHPDQSGVGEDAFRFVLALRGMGEGHLSSVTFRTGIWRGAIDVTVDPPSGYAVAPQITVKEAERGDGPIELVCDEGCDLSETVLFPALPSQAGGIEDLRMVHFTHEGGSCVYYGTYTAFSGTGIRSEMLKTRDFSRFQMIPLSGAATQGKGMALFPRRIDGRYAMLGRQDNESIWLLQSDDLYVWNDGKKIIAPRFCWDAVQMGNCGSPIEIDEGWLVLTHGVGAMRSYTIGAALLDKDDPNRLLGRTTEPILRPRPHETDGYVPNVVYSCGGLVRGRRLMLPYAIADDYTRFASIPLDSLLAALR